MDSVSVGLREPFALEPTAPITPPKQPAQMDLKGVWARIRQALARLWPKRGNG
jgi:hypothetical protein